MVRATMWTALGATAVAATVAMASEGKRSEPGEAALVRAEQAAGMLGKTLRSRVMEEMQAGGPLQALAVCADEAQALTREVQERSGVQVGRSSLRLRNPANAGPDWVTAWLTEQGERPAEGVQPVKQIADTPQGKVARVIRPIALEGGCVACHGPREGIPDPVKKTLDERYPSDRAVGYRPGDLRGALWAEAPVE